MLDTLRHAVRAIRQRGIRFLVVYFRESKWFDLWHGTTTSARVTKDRQKIAAADAERSNGLLYVASFTSVVLRSIEVARRLLGEARAAEAQFLDLGCGKGKTLLVYALGPGLNAKHASVGIEYDPALAEEARRNLRTCKIAENKVVIATDSATNLRQYVTAEVLVVYIYNSFQGETLRSVLKALKAYPHVLIYVDPAERQVLPGLGYTICEDVKGKYNADTWLVATSGLDAAAGA
jgi:SAM-dependent methyltransferase